MQTNVEAVLAQAGVAKEASARLAQAIAAPPPDSFPADELHDATPARIALLAAIVAARDAHRLRDSLPRLLRFVASAREPLSDYDQARLWHLQGFAAWRLDDSAYRATVLLNRSVAALSAADDDASRGYLPRVFDTFGQLSRDQGLLRDALQQFELARRQREALDDEAGLALTLGNLGRLAMELGDFATAREHLERDLELVERLTPDNLAQRAQLLSHLGFCQLDLGRADEASELFTGSADLARVDHDVISLAFAELGLGRAALARGESELAQRHCGQLRALLEESDETVVAKVGLSARTHWLAADIQLAAGDVESACNAFADAHQAAIGGSVPPVEMASILRGYAHALQAQGRTQESAHRYRTALQYLDATAADTLRDTVDRELRDNFRESWLLHSAGRFIGHEQVEMLLSEAGNWGFHGRGHEVAILFADIRGFTALSEHLEPGELLVLLNDYLTHMTRCIEQFGGMVDKFIGDAIMAVFTLPTPAPDDALRAAEGALMMQTELERFNRQLPAGIPRFAIGIGVHFGGVVAGLIGSPRKRSYTVLGDAVNTASRLEGMTKKLGARALVSSQVYERLLEPDRFLLRPLGRYRPKGRRQAVAVAELMGEDDGSPFAHDLRDEIEATGRAIELLQDRQFVRAREAFEELAADHAGELRAEGYRFLGRCAATYRQTPPPRDWRGDITLAEK